MASRVFARPLVAGSRGCRQCRHIQISAAETRGPLESDVFGGEAVNRADARFEVLGAPHAVLSVSLSPSQNLYTRRGTLIGVAGTPTSVQSTLSVLPPVARAPLGIPFLYQRITSTTPTTALISPSSPSTTLTVLHLDGTTDWLITQRSALLAWTGHALSLKTKIQTALSLAHWGSTQLTGRGLVALAAPGEIYKLVLSPGEKMALHPSHIIGYAQSRNLPLPFRFKATNLQLSVPSVISSWFSNLPAIQNFQQSEFYRVFTRLTHSIRTTLRRSIWGDRLFLHFEGPATLLVSSRAVRMADVLSTSQLNEIADAPAGDVKALTSPAAQIEEGPVITKVSAPTEATLDASQSLKEKL